jgi:hypothetical protein
MPAGQITRKSEKRVILPSLQKICRRNNGAHTKRRKTKRRKTKHRITKRRQLQNVDSSKRRQIQNVEIYFY